MGIIQEFGLWEDLEYVANSIYDKIMNKVDVAQSLTRGFRSNRYEVALTKVNRIL